MGELGKVENQMDGSGERRDLTSDWMRILAAGEDGLNPPDV